MKIEYALLGARVVFAEHEASVCKRPQGGYICPACRGSLVLRHATPKERGGRYNVSAFFAHKSVASRCAGASGESLDHLKSKFALQRFVGHYDFCYEECPHCAKRLGFVSRRGDRVQLEATVALGSRTYRYDALISRGLGHRVAVEILHTHKTAQEKVAVSEEHGIRVVELRASDVLASMPRLEQALLQQTHVRLPNLLVETKRACCVCATMHIYDETTHDAAEAWTALCGALEHEASHNWERLVAPLVAELRRLSAARRLHGLKRKAFERARAYAEDFEEARAKRTKGAYQSGLSFKCVGCCEWQTHGNRIPRRKFTDREYMHAHEWFVQRRAPLPACAQACTLCSITCIGCGEFYLLEHACRYGLCRDCNMKARDGRRS
ncbi:MAG: hypothetical protein EBR51_00265 [Gammaproteobacteria bacterium]|jgi:hypothetical protein|nr:hypothetical protein [Gammaproteobacteria bacterium]